MSRQTEGQARSARRLVTRSPENRWSGSGSAYRRPIGFAVAGVGLLAVGAAWVVSLGSSPARAGSASLPSRAEADCCSYARPASDNPGGFWVTALVAGAEYRFALLPGSSLPPGGEWSAGFGEIEPDGTYRAPRVAPPSGLDSVRYSTPEGLVATAWVRLEEAPGHSFEQAWAAPDAFHAQSSHISPEKPNPDARRHFAQLANPRPTAAQREAWAVTQWAQRDWLDSVPHDGRWHPVRKSDEPDDTGLAPVSDCSEIVATANGSLLPVSTYLGSNERRDIVGIQADSQGVQQKTPRRCKTGPINPVPNWNEQPCDPPGATKRVDGPVKRFKKYLGFNPNAGSIRITAKIRADLIRLFNVDVEVGAEVRFGRHSYQYREFQTFDFYKCVNGRWQYDRTVVCERDSIGSRTDPRWANFIFGSPINGDPDGWSSWVCNPLP